MNAIEIMNRIVVSMSLLLGLSVRASVQSASAAVEFATQFASWWDIQLAQACFAAEERNAAMVTTCDIGNLHDYADSGLPLGPFEQEVRPSALSPTR